MGQPAEKPRRLTPTEYAALERGSDVKHEYLRGRIYAMSGASPKHNAVAMNLAAALRVRLRGKKCIPLGSDQAVYVEATDMNTYPDVMVVCDQAQLHRDFPRSITNPTVIVEVLSPSTEAYDRGTKFEHYRRLPSLREYVLVATDHVSIDHFVREPDGRWTLREVRGSNASLRLVRLTRSFPSRRSTKTSTSWRPKGSRSLRRRRSRRRSTNPAGLRRRLPLPLRPALAHRASTSASPCAETRRTIRQP